VSSSDSKAVEKTFIEKDEDVNRFVAMEKRKHIKTMEHMFLLISSILPAL
jgi:hypothetical protein